MRAGPNIDFPVVTTIPANSPVQIFGCVQNQSWCDTAWGSQRGWVSNAYLSSVWQRAPIVVYNQDNYYNAYYVGRPWYPSRHVYVGPNHICYHGPFASGCRSR